MPAKKDTKAPILEINNLSISFFTRLREIPAVMDFSCVVQPGEAMGLVCLLYTSPSPRDSRVSRMPSSA